MNLTYEIVDGGYNILKDGKVWMVQPKGIFPHEGATVEESAQNHINAIIADNEAPSTEQPGIEELRAKVNQQEQAIADLSMMLATLMV